MKGIDVWLSRTFENKIEFFRGWQRDKAAVGAFFPTSRITADRMASVITTSSNLPVLELGPGTGVITQAILRRGVSPKNLISVEYSAEFSEYLRQKFPDVDIRTGDAFDLDSVLSHRDPTQFDAIVSAVPLVQFDKKKRAEYVMCLLERLPLGRPVVQITHSPLPPISTLPAGYKIKHLAYVLRNIPPARLWTYCKVP